MRPELFGDFLLVQRLSRSAMAETLVAVRLGDRTGRTFVVKRPVLGERASGTAAQALLREADVLAAVRSTGLPALEASGEIAGLPYVATEHIRGVALDALLADGPLDAAATAVVAHDVATTLAALHAAGWVHRDLTPSNVLVDDAGEARVVDLGLAARVAETPAHLVGTPGYVAPEAVRSVPASPALDVYSWAALVAECSTGRRLFTERDLADAAARPEPVRLDAELGALRGPVSAALHREPTLRPAAEQLVADVPFSPGARAALADRVAHASGPPEAPAAPNIARPRALTPTEPMPPVRPALTWVDDGSDAAVAARATTSPVPQRRPGPGYLGPLLVVVAALTIVGLAGLRLARPRPATLALASALPKRSVLEIDGHATTTPDVGSVMTLTPGRHIVTVIVARSDRREYSIDVRAGDHVLLFPLLRTAGAANEARDP
jgi:serine/threonine-protein kinase